MTKYTYLVAAMLYSILSYGQQITFYKNINYRASLLEQNLNEGRDSLVLKSTGDPIQKVEIFNKNFSKSYDVANHKTKIDLKTLPLGSFVIQARMGEKWIVMSIKKNEEPKIALSGKKEANKEKDIDYNSVAFEHKSHNISSIDQKAKEIDYKGINPPNLKPDDNLKKKSSIYCWVVSESNSSFGSNKSMRLEYKEDIAKLISKNKLELKSSVGKNNKLLIYEIYNTTKFMPNQLKNPVYYKSEKSEFFNVVPVYASIDEDMEDF